MKPRQGGGDPNRQTPQDFLEAVEWHFCVHQFAVDLASTDDNPVGAKRVFTKADDGLAQDWESLRGALWLNPPFNEIPKWAAKCAALKPNWHRTIFFLVPASVGAKWFRDHVWGKARIYFLTDRIQFVGVPWVYPKDLMLCLYGEEPGVEFWGWKCARP